MMQPPRRLLVLAILGSAAAFAVAAERSVSEAYRGAWKARAGESLLHVSADRIISHENDRLTVREVVCQDRQSLFVREDGFIREWSLSLAEDVLVVGSREESREYVRLEEVPPILDLTPSVIGESKELPEHRVKAIQAELRQRMKDDQAVLKNPDHTDAEWSEIRSSNTRYLKDLVKEIGWIGRARFGDQAFGDAVILAKHSEDIPLITAVLPFVEREVKATRKGGQVFSVLYDGLQINLGKKQRYGSQLAKDAAGAPVVKPLEDPKAVEELRKEIGLQPLAEYLALASQVLYEGQEITMLEEPKTPCDE
jgi:hypothetical protein